MRKSSLSRVEVQVTQDTADLLEDLAREQGITRSALLKGWLWDRMQQELDHRSRVRQRLAAIKKAGH